MNLLLRILTVGSLLTAAHAFAADAFEGGVTLAITSDKGRTMDMNYTMKAKRLRMDMNSDGHSMSTIMDMEKLEMLMLMPEQRMYMVMPIKQTIDQAAAAGRERAAAGGNDRAASTDIVRTGKTEKILGYNCEQILVTDKAKGTVTELWVAQDLGMFMGLGSGGGPFGGRSRGSSAAAAKWEEVLKGKGGFPLRVISRDASGKQSFKMEATKIEPGPQPESLFVPPDGYKKFQMPDLGGLNPFKQG